MTTVTLKGTPVTLQGPLPEVGSPAPEFTVVKTDLSEQRLSDLKGKKVVLNIFPSIDTAVCALQLKTFSQRLGNREDVAAVFVSMDLPFAHSRFCGAEGISNAITGSDFRYRSLGQRYGVGIKDGPLAGLYARATLVIDENGIVRHAELVKEVTEEPDYDAALTALAGL
jgi:thioredoxin-dependent peroxiredoxin